jgi:hypothetical protein
LLLALLQLDKGIVHLNGRLAKTQRDGVGLDLLCLLGTKRSKKEKREGEEKRQEERKGERLRREEKRNEKRKKEKDEERIFSYRAIKSFAAFPTRAVSSTKVNFLRGTFFNRISSAKSFCAAIAVRRVKRASKSSAR